MLAAVGPHFRFLSVAVLWVNNNKGCSLHFPFPISLDPISTILLDGNAQASLPVPNVGKSSSTLVVHMQLLQQPQLRRRQLVEYKHAIDAQFSGTSSATVFLAGLVTAQASRGTHVGQEKIYSVDVPNTVNELDNGLLFIRIASDPSADSLVGSGVEHCGGRAQAKHDTEMWPLLTPALHSTMTRLECNYSSIFSCRIPVMLMRFCQNNCNVAQAARCFNINETRGKNFSHEFTGQVSKIPSGGTNIKLAGSSKRQTQASLVSCRNL